MTRPNRQKYNHQMRALRVVILGCLVASCNTAPPPPPFKPVADLKQLMQSVVEPAADEYWDAVGWIEDAGGSHEIAPTTDAPPSLA